MPQQRNPLTGEITDVTTAPLPSGAVQSMAQASYSPYASDVINYSGGGYPQGATLPGAGATGYTPAYGGIPQVPAPGATQAGAIGANLANLGSLYGLAGSVNAFNQAQAPLGLRANLPGYQGMIGQSSQNIMANLAGQVPLDVQNQIAQAAAERGAGRGLGAGAPNVNAALLAALGKTSLGQQQLGEQQLTAAIARTPQGPMFDPSKFFITPADQQAAQTAANLYGAAPIPSAAAEEARRQARAGIGETGGGYTLAPTAPSRTAAPFQATTWAGAPAPTAASSLGTGLTYGGQTYYGGATPQTAASNWAQWAAGLPSTTPTGLPGTGSFYAGAANPMYADEYDQLFGLGGAQAPGTYGPTDVPMAPGGIDEALSQFYDTGPAAGFTGTTDWTTSSPDLFGGMSPSESDLYFG